MARVMLVIYDDSYKNAIQIGTPVLGEVVSQYQESHPTEEVIVFMLHVGSYSQDMHHKHLYAHAGGRRRSNGGLDDVPPAPAHNPRRLPEFVTPVGECSCGRKLVRV